MPLVYRKDEKYFTIGIWESTEAIDELAEQEGLNHHPEYQSGFRSENRRREFVTVRALLRSLLPAGSQYTLEYDSFGKPRLDLSYSISISHTGKFVAILLSDGLESGLDLELLRPGIDQLARKFVSPAEFEKLEESHLAEQLHIIWGAKEVLYKIYGRKQLDFKNHLYVLPFSYASKGSIKAGFRKNTIHECYEIQYEIWQNCMLAYSMTDWRLLPEGSKTEN